MDNGRVSAERMRRSEDVEVAFRVTRYAMKVIDLLVRLRQDGWAMVATRGSHRQFKHPTKPGRVTVPGKLSDDLAIGTWRSILKQAGLEH